MRQSDRRRRFRLLFGGFDDLSDLHFDVGVAAN
jgi:hypothetical protein